MNLSTRVLEAGGSIEQRASYPDYHKFVDQYVFTKEQLQQFMEQLAGEALTAIETYNQYDIKTDSYAHSTDLIWKLRSALKHKRMPLQEPIKTKLFK